VRSVFGNAIDTTPVRIRRRRWFPLQPRRVTMAPMGHLYFHPRSDSYCEDFAKAKLERQAHFIHEMTHVWQAQTKGRWYLPLHRPFSRRYAYSLVPGWTLEDYGIEQQAEIVSHAFMAMQGKPVVGAPPLKVYQQILPFKSIAPKIAEDRT
jgi:hypothetical protein